MAAEKKTVAARGPSIFSKIGAFFQESWQELKKVSWPSKAEVNNFTMVVIAAVTFVGVCLYTFDGIMSLLTRSLFE